MTEAMPTPLTPHDCDLRDFPRMMIDIPRLRGSEFDATTDDSAWRAGFNLWLTAWHQVPAGSLSSDDASLAKAAGLGRDLRTWRKIKAAALRGWVGCDDGRLYHPTVAEIVLESWLEKLQQRIASGSGNAKRWGGTFDPGPVETDIALAIGLLGLLNPQSKAMTKAARRLSRRPAGGSDPDNDRNPTGTEKPSHRDAKTPGTSSQGTGTGTGKNKKEGSEAKASALELVIADPDKAAWDLAKALLLEREGVAEKAAGSFFGGLLARNGLLARDMLPALTAPAAQSTSEARAYLTRAAEGIGKRRTPAPRSVGFV